MQKRIEMEENILIIHNKTEATATIRGFHYQFLKTLKSWLECLTNSNEEIYCETEDDLMEINNITNFVRFTQIKSYSSEFTLNSKAIKKTIINFFSIFNRYQSANNKLEFVFYSNSSPITNSTLEEWVLQANPSEDLTNKFCNEVYKILIEKYSTQTLESQGIYKNSENLLFFVKSIKWFFENKTPDESIKDLIFEIKNLISDISDSTIAQEKPELLLSKLHFDVEQTSINSDRKYRKLIRQKLIDLVAEEDSKWYVNIKKEWLENNPIYFSFGEFYSIRTAILHAHYTEYLKSDIPFWIEKLYYFIENCENETITKRQAIYEVIIISLRSLKNLDNRGKYIKAYFQDFNKYIDVDQLEETTILLNFLRVAKQFETFDIPIQKDKIEEYVNLLNLILLSEIEKTTDPNRLCYLFETKGNFDFFFSKDNNLDKFNDLQQKLEKSNFWYNKILSELEKSRLFPLRRFIQNQNKKLITLHQIEGLDLSNLEEIIEKAEDIYNKERFKDLSFKKQRAFNYIEKGESLKALRVLHDIKNELFKYESLEESLHIMLLISQLYLELGLAFAAKYYGLAVCHWVMQEGGEFLKLLPKSVEQVGEADYNQGQWGSYMFFNRAYFLSKQTSLTNFENEIDNAEISLFHSDVTISFLNKRFNFISQAKLAKIFPIDDNYKNEISLGVKKLLEKYKKNSDKKLWEQIEEQMIDAPFSDYGNFRKLSFKTYGVKWYIVFKNEYTLVASVEQFLAFFQIVLFELNEVDLCLPVVEVRLNISENTINDNILIESNSTNQERIWNIKLPNYEKLDKGLQVRYLKELELSLLKNTNMILFELSPLNDELLFKIFKEVLIEKTHLSNKVSISKPYEEMYKVFVIEEHFTDIYKSVNKKLPFHFDSKLETMLLPKSGLGPTYDRVHNLQQIQNRYDRLIPLIQFTLERLVKDIKFRAILNILKNEGYLDWQILACIANIKFNYYNHQAFKKGHSHQECIELVRKLSETPENKPEDSNIPLNEFTIEKFREELKRYIISNLQSYHLVFRDHTPLIEPLKNLLIQRYNYKIDDVEHPNYWGI